MKKSLTLFVLSIFLVLSLASCKNTGVENYTNEVSYSEFTSIEAKLSALTYKTDFNYTNEVVATFNAVEYIGENEYGKTDTKITRTQTLNADNDQGRIKNVTVGASYEVIDTKEGKSKNESKYKCDDLYQDYDNLFVKFDNIDKVIQNGNYSYYSVLTNLIGDIKNTFNDGKCYIDGNVYTFVTKVDRGYYFVDVIYQYTFNSNSIIYTCQETAEYQEFDEIKKTIKKIKSNNTRVSKFTFQNVTVKSVNPADYLV